MSFIDTTLNSSGYRLFSAYLKLETAQRTLDPKNPAYHKNKSRRKIIQEYQAANLDATINDVETQTPEKAEVLRELQAARKHRKTAEIRRQAEREKQLLEEENESKAIAEGTMAECGCCFSDYPLNRMVHCNSEKVLHWFCRGCARQMASTAIGNSKYQLQCMSTEGCEAGFSMSQRYVLALSVFLSTH
jgi:TRIAD3 protein (E3 ubiquitin-protein ligase RNF216)